MTEKLKLLDPVNGSEVPKVDNAIAVGEDLGFQERWWTFERIVWSFFVLVLIADVLGLFGAGWLAHAQVNDPATAMRVHYDRVARTGTPNSLAIHFAPDAVSGGVVKLIVSDSVIRKLGAQRVIPQPQTSAISAGTMVYTFPAGDVPGEVDFELEPGAPGIFHFTVRVPGHTSVTRRVVVVP
ncbi:hypothetical protein [Terriglobus roseus]|uniref:Uncharacterized protein n=1 Tax=Terriglobus roseus TaxID=392734 RepID=A0A1H4KGZ7_9BACT|nr:hypothetical protein [Terriglobus roseus]SEB57673.1 hypothetical protein SAMN05443244_1189 [Terriglobus roseus]